MRPFARIRFALACALLAGAALWCPAQQQPRRVQHAQRPEDEQILDFHSEITLNEDSSLLVTETISVVSTGKQIRHGIYRDLPTRYTDAGGNRYVVGFQFLSATLDSAPESARVEDYSNGKRIYLGDPKYFVQPGRHVYTISYTTNRQLGFFADHDELFWNVTGNGWVFDIEHASATVHLPSAIPAEQVHLAGFTGLRGSQDADLTTSSENSVFEFTATKRLAAHQGLSILLNLPKGYFHEPTFNEKVAYFFQDNRSALLLTGGFLAILIYYLLAWTAVGRDPARGAIMALYEPPPNLSPAAMRYLLRMGFDNKTFAVAILDMAVRGYLTIKQQAGSYTLYLTGKNSLALTPDEKQVAEYLFAGRDQIWLHNENHQTIQAAIQALKKWLAAAEQKTYFVTNSRYLIAPVSASLLIVLAYLASLGGPQIFMGVFISFWLTLWTLGVATMAYSVSPIWRPVLRRHRSALADAGDTGKAVLFTVFCIPFLGGEAMGLFFLRKLTSLALVVFITASGALHALFMYLMKAPTFTGRRLMDQVEGFKMFLGAVDGDRLNRAAPPEQTPAAFEKFLPYALALDVEQDWAEKFSAVLAGADRAPSSSSAYTPSFYSGPSWNGNGFSGTSFASAFSGSLTSAISSSATAPGSGGAGGGGGSGGGGGGGGGGGW